MKCSICESSGADLKYQLYDDRHGYPGIFNVFSCRACKHSFLKYKDKLPEQTRLYSEYYPRSKFKLNNYRPHKVAGGFSSWLNGNKSRAYTWVPKNIRILDIGCGYGESLGYHRERGCEVYGVDCDENLQKVANYYGFNAMVGSFDSKNYEKKFFDYVTLDQVIEHMDKPIETLIEIKKILKTDGCIIVGTPNILGWGKKIFGKRWINWHVPYHLQYFSEHSMQIAASKAGLEIKDVLNITPSGWLFYQMFHLLTYPKMGAPSSFWMKMNKLSSSQIFLRKIINFMNNLKIYHLITRALDLCGLGDNKLYILGIK